jgi:hypothetical protein
MYLGSLFGPPPPDAAAIAWVDQAQWPIVLFAYWLDRHRAAAAPPLANRAAAL